MRRMPHNVRLGIFARCIGYCDFRILGSKIERSRVKSSAFMPGISEATHKRIEVGAFAGVPVQEGFAAEHRREVLRHPGRKSVGPLSFV